MRHTDDIKYEACRHLQTDDQQEKTSRQKKKGGRKRSKRRRPPISELLKPGAELICQVIKDPDDPFYLPCKCGEKGHLETLVSGRGAEKLARVLSRQGGYQYDLEKSL